MVVVHLIEAILAINTDTSSGNVPGECTAENGVNTIVFGGDTVYKLTEVNNRSDKGANGLPIITTEVSIVR
jgi:hypothetical protein